MVTIVTRPAPESPAAVEDLTNLGANWSAALTAAKPDWALFTDATHVVHVSKVGSDSDDGLSPDLPKLTIGAGITAAAALASTSGEQAVVWVGDGGTYTEDLTTSADVFVFAPNATIVGEHVINGDRTGIHAARLYPAADDTAQVIDCTGSGDKWLSFRELDTRGVSGAVASVNGIREGTNDGILHLTGQKLYVGANGRGLVDTGGPGSGHVHGEQISDIYLAGNNAVGVMVNNPGTDFYLRVGHILELGSHTGTQAIEFNGTASGELHIDVQQIIADVAWNDPGNGMLFIDCPDVNGTTAGTEGVAVYRSLYSGDASNGIADAPADGTRYGRSNGAWVEVLGPPPAGGQPHAPTNAPDGYVALGSMAEVGDAPADGTLYGRQDNAWVEVVGGGGGSSTAADTTYDNSDSGLAATDVKAALDELDDRTAAPLVAVIAGANADAAVKAATDYVEGTDDIETVIATALTDGYRSFLLAGTCTATAAVDIDTTEAVEIYAAPNASLVGDLTISAAGGTVRLLAPVTGTITDSNGRIERPVQGVGVAKIRVLTQAEYDVLTPDPLTTYFITDAT